MSLKVPDVTPGGSQPQNLPLTITASVRQPMIISQNSEASQAENEVTENDERVTAIQRLFRSVTHVVHGEVDVSFRDYLAVVP